MRGYARCCAVSHESSNPAAALKALAAGRLPQGVPTQGLPRLRFDRVALRVVRDLQDALADVPPARAVLVVTVTAPMRLPGSTVAQLDARLHGPPSPQIRCDAGRQPRARPDTALRRLGSARVIVFVHNPQPAPARLFKLVALCLSSLPRGPRTRASRPQASGLGK